MRGSSSFSSRRSAVAGRDRSSAMGKKPPSSSASLKKKRSKASSKVRVKKTSKTKRRSKSKKSSRHRYDSDSYSSDYDSLTSSTMSSEEDYRRRSKRRARSPSKKTIRRSKKRSRGQSYSAESSEDLPSRKKRKGSKRDGKLSLRMKRSRKKSKRRVSVSSASSGSYCSTCAESSSDSGQSESQSYRASSERKDKDRWAVEKGKTESKGRGYSPRSYSPISHHSISGGDESAEVMRGGNNSMRLRSVIMVNNEDGELHAYGHKEEITYENDDYPSCKSNDSNDSGGKRELNHHLLVESELKRQVDNEIDEEAVVSDMNPTAITEDGQKSRNNISSVIVGTIHAVRDDESNVSDGPDGNDLESMLRQRALENLKKFRGVNKNTAALSAQKENVDDDKKQSLVATSESSHHKFPDDNVANAPPVEGNGANSDSSVKRDFISIKLNDASLGDKGSKIAPAIMSQSSEVGPDRGRSGFKESGFTRQSVVKRLHEGTTAANVKQEVIPTFASNTSNPRVTSYTWRRESAKGQASSKELHPSSGPPQTKLMVRKGIGGETDIETVGTENKVEDNEVHEKHASPALELPSHTEPVAGAASSDKDGNDAKDGPQYEQKTMSVTRGGETIRVNYQVYIPKRAPALARRQLKR